MNDITDHGAAGERSGESARRGRLTPVQLTSKPEVEASHEPLAISCDECSMQGTDACNDCLVTFLVGPEAEESLVLDLDQARVVRLLGQAGLVPDLKYRVAG